ncbi:93_t:CDS:2 [Paraglomus brasilianum]|uniref:93_t:CDS:1 n=1 Tax=Paraglomus brasilianum TaxID=144538 RepID=A0A9N8ZDU3_9GLOM|nr:93_t:CDS:2 [Paraglomus brasilianum]
MLLKMIRMQKYFVGGYPTDREFLPYIIICPYHLQFWLAILNLNEEIRNNADFQEWFSQNIKAASVTLLACSDDALHALPRKEL